MLRKKKSSQDSEASGHRKKSREEEKAERRKQKSELRFLKNIGSQTDVISAIPSSALSTEITTQTHATKKASRRSQTKLTSIEKPSTTALQHPLSIRRKISLPSSDPSRLSIVSLGSPSSPLDFLDISSHGLRDIPSPIVESEGPFGATEESELQRPSKLEMDDTEMNEVKMRKKSSEVEKRLRRRRRKADATASGTMRESLSSASSVSSLISPETSYSVDEDGVRVAEVSIDVYLFNGQLDQSGYQFIVDPIEGRRNERTDDRSLLPSDGIRRIEIKYDWEEEELEDEEDEIMGKSGREIVGEEDEVEAWCFVAETQTEWGSEEIGIQMRPTEIEGINRDYGTQSDAMEMKKEFPPLPPILTEMTTQTAQRQAFDKGSQFDSPSTSNTVIPPVNKPLMKNGDTQTDPYEEPRNRVDISEVMSQTDPILPHIEIDAEMLENFSQTDQIPPPSPPPQASSTAQTENVSPLLESQPCLAEGSTQTDNIEAVPPLLPSVQEGSCQTDIEHQEEKESLEGSSQTDFIEEPKIQSQIPKKEESHDSETQCEIMKESTEMNTQTEDLKEEKEVVRETKETQYDEVERSEVFVQTEKEVKKEVVVKSDQECQSEELESTSVELQTDEIFVEEKKQKVPTVEMEVQTENETKEEPDKEEKEIQCERALVVDADIQTEQENEVEKCTQGIQSEPRPTAATECQTEKEVEKEVQEQGTQPECSFSTDYETQTEEMEEQEETEDRECQTEEEVREDGWTQPECSLFNTIDQECQYWLNTVEGSTQFDQTEKGEIGCQTEREEVVKEDEECQTDFDLPQEIEREDVAVGTEEIFKMEIGSETDPPSISSTSSQSTVTLNSSIQHGVQTERDIRHRKIQTDEVKKKLKKKVEKLVAECQTDRDLLRETNCSAQTCSPPPSPPPFPVGFSVMDASTQCTSPMVTTSQTQYSSSCIRETSVQTDFSESVCAESQVDPFDVSPFGSSFHLLSNMIDVGIQTGVLARVEHMYAAESRPEIIRGIAELHRSNSVNSQDSDVSSIFRGPSTVRVAPAMVGRDRRDSTESIERRPSTSSSQPSGPPPLHLATGSISSLRSRFETPSTSDPISPTSKEKISVDATTEKTKVKKVVKKKKASEE